MKDPLWRYIEEREMIRLRRERGQPWPWTDDPILQKYRFTNVRRVHDRTTQALLAVYRAHRDAPPAEALYNCAAYRWFGTAEFARELGWMDRHDEEAIRRAHDALVGRGASPWTSAYVTAAGRRGEPKWKAVAGRLADVWRAARPIAAGVEKERSWWVGSLLLSEVPGHGGTGFMGKEILQDFLLWLDGRWSIADAETWTPIGPGARRGLNRLAGRPVLANASPRALLGEILDHRARVNPRWQAAFPGEPPLTAHDVQFCCCEVQKYLSAQEGSRPKRIYAPPLAARPEMSHAAAP